MGLEDALFVQGDRQNLDSRFVAFFRREVQTERPSGIPQNAFLKDGKSYCVGIFFGRSDADVRDATKYMTKKAGYDSMPRIVDGMTIYHTGGAVILPTYALQDSSMPILFMGDYDNGTRRALFEDVLPEYLAAYNAQAERRILALFGLKQMADTDEPSKNEEWFKEQAAAFKATNTGTAQVRR